MDDAQLSEPSEVFAARQGKAFLGTDVDWALRFADGYEELPGYARLLFQSRAKDMTYVAVTVQLSEYPWLERLRRGEPLQVHGRIAEVGTRSIELKDASLLRLT
jgi:hypothetical protein